MKKILFGLIATVMFTGLSFGQNFENFIKPELYGIYHNEVLKVYTEKHKGEKTSNFISLYDNLKNEFDILYPNAMTKEENTFYKNRIVSILGVEGNLNSSNYHEVTIIRNKKILFT